MTKMQAEKQLVVRLERALEGIRAQVIEQGRLIQSGVNRLIWYSSCFTDNYQDVCAKLKEEDVQFAWGIVQFSKHKNLIHFLVQLYVEPLLRGFSEERLNRIAKVLSKKGAIFISGKLSLSLCLKSNPEG